MSERVFTATETGSAGEATKRANVGAASSDGPRLTVWEYTSFTITHVLATGLLYLLSLQGLYKFGRMFGTIEWLINFKRRRRFAEALRYVFDEEPVAAERRRHMREFFMQSRCDKLFYLVFDRITREAALTRLTITNQKLLDDALARGHGAYMAMSHHGPLHVLAMLMALRGYKTAGVRDRREGALRRYIQDRFDRRYPDFQRMRILYADGFPREIFRCLQDGFVLGSAMDVDRVRDPRQRTQEVTVFGERQHFLSGPMRISIRCQTSVLQAFILPERDFRYRLEIVETLIDAAGVEDEDAAVSQAMQRYAANVERYIRRYPSLVTRV
jgi:lauroyl/myristoyl acyltransferase